ncbi:MAG: class I SAM-dependent methyltransferase, partial [Gemmatimonas sp.]
DVSPGAVAVMQERGVRHAACIDWESQLRKGAESFDTLLLLNRGFGLTGTPEGLRTFLQLAHRVVRPGGQIVGDWREPPCPEADAVAATERPSDVSTRDPTNPPYRQREMWVQYGSTVGRPFQLLDSTFDELHRVAEAEGWHAELLWREDDAYATCLTALAGW